MEAFGRGSRAAVMNHRRQSQSPRVTNDPRHGLFPPDLTAAARDFLNDGIIEGFALAYPAAARVVFDPVVERIEDSFRPGR